MSNLVLPVKRIWFDDIKSGDKPEEYRLVCEHWTKRLVGRTYDAVIVTLGYPKHGQSDRVQVFAWSGYQVKTITHPHFGTEPVKVYAIPLKEKK